MFESTIFSGQIYLGKQGEHYARRFSFQDVVIWKETFGEGRCELLHQRNGESVPYPVILTVENGVPYWYVSEVDTAIAGLGKCEVRYIVDDVVVKSNIYTTFVQEALGEGAEKPPEAAKPWVDQVLDAAKKVEDASEDIKNVSTHPPIISDNGNWLVWDSQAETYVDTGVFAGNMERGLGENSIQQPSCQAVSDYSVAFGDETSAGQRGYYVKTFNTDGTLILSAEVNESNVSEGVTLADFTGIAKKDEICIINGDHFDFCGTVKSIGVSSIVITWAAHFDPSEIDTTKPIVFLIPKKATVGLELLESNGDKVFGGWNIVGGRTNYVGRYSAAFGRNNIVTDYGIGAGSGNKVSYCGVGLGASNKVYGKYGVGLGSANEIRGDYSQGIGRGLQAFSDNQSVRGQFNRPDANGKYIDIFGDGTGTKAADRSNAYTLDKDGVAWFKKEVKVGGIGYNYENAETLISRETANDIYAFKNNSYEQWVTEGFDETQGYVIRPNKNTYGDIIFHTDGATNPMVFIDPGKADKKTYPIDIEYYGTNLLDLNRCELNRCIKTGINSIRCAFKAGADAAWNYYANIRLDYLNNVIQAMDGEKLTLSLRKPVTDYGKNFYMAIVIYYNEPDENGSTFVSETNAKLADKSKVSIKLNHNGRTVKYIDLRPVYNSDKFYDTTSVVEGLQLEFGEVSGYAMTIPTYPVRLFSSEDKRLISGNGKKLVVWSGACKDSSLRVGLTLPLSYYAEKIKELESRIIELETR